MTVKEPTLGLEVDDGLIEVFRLAKTVGWDDFLDKWKMREALRIASAANEEERTRVQVRVLLIDELRNFTNGLLNLDKKPQK